MSHCAALVKTILKSPSSYEWSLQGFGMLRLYLSESLRLHVWDGRYTQNGVENSMIHDHPWGFDSLVLSGHMTNFLFEKCAQGCGEVYQEQQIICGPGGCAVGEPLKVWLRLKDHKTLIPEQRYSQTAEEIHRSAPSPGCVTLVDRRFRSDRDRALVYWKGERWVSAEPRPATQDEAASICMNALRLWNGD